MTEIQFSENAPRVRKNFSKIPAILEIPNLIEIQKQSFERFLQTQIEPEKRENTGPAGRVQLDLPDQGLQRHRFAGVRRLRARAAEVRRAGVPPARHDLRRAVQGDDPPRRLGRRRGRADDPRREGAGGLLRGNPDHDRQRHLHHQRHRARDRLAAPPLARHLLRHHRRRRRSAPRARSSSPAA